MKYIVKCTSREDGTVAFVERDGWGGILLRSDRANATTIDSMPKAIDAWCRASMLADEPRIYQVANDGMETPLPTYEEALRVINAIDAALCSDSSDKPRPPLDETIKHLDERRSGTLRRLAK